MKQKIIDYIEDLEWKEQEYYKLQTKIDKAIEYIREHKKTITKQMAKDTRLEVGTFMWNIDELLEILGD